MANYVIKDIRRGKGYRNQTMYAKLYNEDTGEIVISATLNYITERMFEIIPPEKDETDKTTNR